MYFLLLGGGRGGGGGPWKKIIVFWDLYWGPPILGNYHCKSLGCSITACGRQFIGDMGMLLGLVA